MLQRAHYPTITTCVFALVRVQLEKHPRANKRIQAGYDYSAMIHNFTNKKVNTNSKSARRKKYSPHKGRQRFGICIIPYILLSFFSPSLEGYDSLQHKHSHYCKRLAL